MRPTLPKAVSRRSLALLALTFTLLSAPTGAGAAANVSAAQAEAKEAAKSQGNCTPAKVDVQSYSVGREGQTVFKVGCTEDKDAFVLVQCRARICTLLR